MSKTVLVEEVAVAGAVDAVAGVDYSPKMGKVSGIVPLSVLATHDRESKFTAKKDYFHDRFSKVLRSDNPAFLLKIANAYFSKPLV